MSDYWKDNGITKPQQIVVCAANKYPDGLIACGARHYDKVMRKVLIRFPELNKADCEQGFIDKFGDFLTREEAMVIAKAAKQPISKRRCGGSEINLFSEGLY